MLRRDDKVIPSTVAFILDGNRRWAKVNRLPQMEGHRKGLEKLKQVIRWCDEQGVKNCIFYTFSTENWNRSEAEVSYLMDLFRKSLKEDFKEIMENDAQVIFIGERSRLPSDIQLFMKELEDESRDNSEGKAVFALSYGGRAEIVSAVNKAVLAGEKVDENSFKKHLSTHTIPDPDIIIRTGGEKRLSNFLPWQSVYSELFFVDTLWPAFSKDEFIRLLDEFAKRKRNFGK